MMNTFVMSHFSYCPLIWMFHDRKIDSKINKIQERALRIAYRDNASQFKDLLKKDNSVSIHQRNLQLLMIEIYKTKNRLNPPFMMEIFDDKILPYQLRSASTLNLPKVENYKLWYRYSTIHGSKSVVKIANRNQNFQLVDHF